MKKSTDSSGEYAINIAPLVSKAMKNDARAAAKLWRLLSTEIENCSYSEINKWTSFVAAQIVELVLASGIQKNRVPDGALKAIGLYGQRDAIELRRWVERHDEAMIGMSALDPVPESSDRAKKIEFAKYAIAMGLAPPGSRVDVIAKRIERYRKEKK